MRGVGVDGFVRPQKPSIAEDEKAKSPISKRGYLEVCDKKNHLPQVEKLCLRFLFVLLVALIGFSASTLAQQATIVGTVTDPSGAVIPNVDVSITNTDTSWNRVFPTNDAGQYVAPD